MRPIIKWTVIFLYATLLCGMFVFEVAGKSLTEENDDSETGEETSELKDTCDLGEWFVNAKEAGVFMDLTKEQMKLKKHIVGRLKRKKRKVDCYDIDRYNTVFNIPEDDTAEPDIDEEGLFDELTQESDATGANDERGEQVNAANENTIDDEKDVTGEEDSDAGTNNDDEDMEVHNGAQNDDEDTSADGFKNTPTDDDQENEEALDSDPNDYQIQEADVANEPLDTASGGASEEGLVDDDTYDDNELNDAESDDGGTVESLANVDDPDNQSGEVQSDQNDDEDFIDDAEPENDGVDEPDQLQSEDEAFDKEIDVEAADIGPDHGAANAVEDGVLENESEDELDDDNVGEGDNIHNLSENSNMESDDIDEQINKDNEDDKRGDGNFGGDTLDDISLDGDDNGGEDTLGGIPLEESNDAAQAADTPNGNHMENSDAPSDEESNINEELLEGEHNDEIQDDDSGDDNEGTDEAEDTANEESLLSSIWNSLSGGSDNEDQPSGGGEVKEVIDEMEASNDDGEPSAEATSDDDDDDDAINDMGDGDSTGERIIKAKNDTDIILTALNGVCRKSSCNNMDSLSVTFNGAINTNNRKGGDAKEIGKSAIKNGGLSNFDGNFLKSHVTDPKKAYSKETLEQLEVDIQQMIDDKTSQYAIKVQSLEILIVRLENQVLLDKLDKQNHTSTFSRLENQILRLENELLRINQNYSELKYDNVNMRAGQMKYLELEHQADQKEQAEASKAQNEVMTQQEARLGELTHQLSVQSDHVDTLRDQSADLAEQNKILSDTVSSQSDMITQIMKKIQHFESRKRDVIDQENTMDIHMGKENAMHQIHSMISNAGTDGRKSHTAGRSALMHMYMRPMFDYITISKNITCCCIAKSIYISLMSFTCVPIDVHGLDEKGFIKLQHRDSTQSDTKTKNASRAGKKETQKKKPQKKSDLKKTKQAPAKVKKAAKEDKTKVAPMDKKAAQEENAKKTEAKQKSANTEDSKEKGSDKKNKIKDKTKTNKPGHKKKTNSTESTKTKNTGKDKGKKTKPGNKSKKETTKETQADAKDAKPKAQTTQAKSKKAKPAVKFQDKDAGDSAPAKDKDVGGSAPKSDTKKKTKPISKEENKPNKGASPASENKDSAATQDEEVDSRPAPLYAAESSEPKDCYDHYLAGKTSDGAYSILPAGFAKAVQVFCDMRRGGWTVFQRRQDGTTNFFREWKEYKKGFGGVYGEHYIGNDVLHHVTNQDHYRLRVDLMDWERTKAFAEYDYFMVDSDEQEYRLHVEGYAGDAGDGLSKHNLMKFSTKDRDNDKIEKEFGGSCANRFQGAGWYFNCYASNLNGKFYKNGVIPEKKFDGITWKPWKGPNYSIMKVEIKIKPQSAKDS